MVCVRMILKKKVPKKLNWFGLGGFVGIRSGVFMQIFELNCEREYGKVTILGPMASVTIFRLQFSCLRHAKVG